MREGTDADLLAEEIRPVYDKDLHGDTVSFTIRLETEGLEHADHLKVRVEKLKRKENEGDSNESSGESWLEYIIRAGYEAW